MALHELAVIERIRALLPGGADLTDDCGALPQAGPGETLLVTTDVMEEDQHFCRTWHPPEMLGRKLLHVNLSDLDASGARPLGYTLTLALPPDLEAPWLEAFLAGLAQATREAGIPVLGGDTVGRPFGLGLGLTAFGAATRWLRRDGLEAGDLLYVDQPLGASLRGLRKLQAGERWNPALPDPDLKAHLDPAPNLGLGPRLAELPEVHACIDLSDGLSKDLRMLAEASRIAILLEAELGPDELTGGEDYARCFAASLSPEDLAARLGRPFRPVARVLECEESGLLTYDGGQLRTVPDRSFDHFSARP